MRTGRLRLREGIGILESREVLAGLSRKFRDRKQHHMHHLHLCDNQFFVSGVDKGRASSNAVNAIIQELLAFRLGCRIILHRRFLEGVRNPVDAPSRPGRQD